MPGSKKGGPQSKHLRPVTSTDDPVYKKLAAGRDAHNKKQSEARKRRQDYKNQLSEFKEQQLETAQSYIEAGVPSPADLIMNMIQEQLIIVANPELKTAELE